MRDKKQEILFIHGGRTGFIARDVRYLEAISSLKEIRVYSFFRPLAKMLEECLRCKVVYCWFAGGHAVIPVILSRVFLKRIVLVAGGYDVASIPEIDYGLMRPGLRRWIARMLFLLADRIVCVSEFNRQEAMRNAKIPVNKIRLIKHGFTDTSRTGTSTNKEALVLTVGEIDRWTLRRKGLLTFARASRYVPEVKWVMAGRIKDDSDRLLREAGGENLSILGFIDDEELVLLMRRAKVYVQVSYHEAFGCSLAEAMIEECVPVVTNRGALAEVVGTLGFYVPLDNPSETAKAVSRALVSSPDLGRRCREHIKEKYSYNQWREAMDELLTEIGVPPGNP